MISITDVKTEYVINSGSGHAIETGDLKEEWSLLAEEEREEWYTAELKSLNFDARTMIEYAVCDMEESGDGYEDMASRCLDDLTDEQIGKLQDVLDEISTSQAYDVCSPQVMIDPRSEVEK